MNRELRTIRYFNKEKQINKRTELIRNLDSGKNEYFSLMNQQLNAMKNVTI